MEAIVVPQLLALVLALGAAAPNGPLPEVRTWEEAAEAPGALLHEPSRLFVQFHSIVEEWEPFQTRFSPERYLAVRAWTDAQLLWDAAEYEDPRALVFVPRGGRLERVVRGLAPHDRVALGCVARTAHLGRPWIEVLGVQRARQQVPEGSVLHAVKALELAERGAFELAVDQFERALAAPLPEHAAEALEAWLAYCDETLAEQVERRTRPASYGR